MKLNILGTSHDNPLAKQLTEAKRRKRWFNIKNNSKLYSEFLKQAQFTMGFKEFKKQQWRLQRQEKKRKRKGRRINGKKIQLGKNK